MGYGIVDTILDKEVLFWTFSTIAQALAALIALSAMFAFYILERHRNVQRASRDQLKRWGEQSFGGVDDEGKRILRPVVWNYLSTSIQLRDVLCKVQSHIGDPDLRARYGELEKNLEKTIRHCRTIRRGLRLMTIGGAFTIVVSVSSLPFVPQMAEGKMCPILALFLFSLAMIGAISTVIFVVWQFWRWMYYVRDI